MFTGLIEAIGKISHLQQSSAGSVITIVAPEILADVKLGDSIAIDGACTTVIAFDTKSFQIEASPETLRKTNFATFKAGSRVNLERPLTPSSRIGGHYVTGHVDGQAVLTQKQPAGLSWELTFRVLDDALLPHLVAKGSVALNGISLTVNWVQADQFGVAIIPHTMSHTTLGDRHVGDSLNIETDLLGKYVQRMLLPQFTAHRVQQPAYGIDDAFLKTHGFAVK